MNYVIPGTNKEEGVVRVLVAIPTIGSPHPEAYCDRLAMFMHMGKLEERGFQLKSVPRFEFYFAVIGKFFVPMAREEAAKMCIEWDCDYLFMIDDDMICPEDLFERLYANDVDIVAPLAFTRNYPHKPVLYSCMEGYDYVSKRDYFLNHWVENYPRNTLVQCDAVGFGSVLIKRWVLDKMQTPRFMSTCGTGEDVFFCYKAGKVGAKVYMDTRVKLGHLSHPQYITEEYVDSLRKSDDLFAKRTANIYDKYSKDNGVKEQSVCFLGDK